jgi:hypothetical protein
MGPVSWRERRPDSGMDRWQYCGAPPVFSEEDQATPKGPLTNACPANTNPRSRVVGQKTSLSRYAETNLALLGSSMTAIKPYVPRHGNMAVLSKAGRLVVEAHVEPLVRFDGNTSDGRIQRTNRERTGSARAKLSKFLRCLFGPFAQYLLPTVPACRLRQS